MPKRTIAIKEFVKEIRSGKPNKELMETYDLDEWGLRNAFKKLVEVKAFTEEELATRMPVFHDTPDRDDRRLFQRRFVLFSFPVYVADSLQEEGLVNDISEQGMQIEGVKSFPGELKSLLIRADEFADIFPFVFEATCRWFNPAGERGQCIAGFEITSISDGGRDELRKLIQILAFD